MAHPIKKTLSLPTMLYSEPLELSIDSFSGRIHIQHFVKVLGKKQGNKLRYVTKIMDMGPKKGSMSHREYGHNREFIFKRFKTKDEKICAYVHLLGDLIQDILLGIMANVGERFKKGEIEGPFYEKHEDGKWGWDIKQGVIEKLLKESSRALIQTLKDKNRIGEIHCE